MTDAGGPPPQSPLPPNANITALVEAIDARARQAGSDGAATLLRGMIGSVSEVLASIQDRLDRMEDLLAERGDGATGAGAGGLVEQVQTGLATFNARLGRLEEAFVQAVEDSGSGTDAVVDQLRRTIVEALGEHQPPPAAAVDLDIAPQLEEAMNPIRARLTGLEQLIRSRNEDRTDPTAAIRAALAPIAERLDGLEIAIRSATDASSERIARIDAATAPLATQLTAAVQQAAATTPTADDKPLLDPELVARLEAAVEQLSRDEATAKVVGLVEERVGAGVQAVVERSEATGRAIDALGDAQTELRGRIDEVATKVDTAAAGQQRLSEDVAEAANQRLGGRFSTLGDRISGLDARLDTIAGRLDGLTPEPPKNDSEILLRIEQAISAIDRRLTAIEAQPPPPPPPAAPPPVDDQRVVDTIRREAEMLTQRVAALAVGVEAARALLQQHVEETENSLGKKAGVVTRRLAADFGFGNRRGRGGGRDRRQLGPGEN